MVAGVKYELVFDAGLSTCANDGTSHTQEACPVSSTSWYTVVVVDQAWMDPRCTLLSHAMDPPRASAVLHRSGLPHIIRLRVRLRLRPRQMCRAQC